MIDDKTIEDYVYEIESFDQPTYQKFRNYIQYIRFPRFKNLRPDTQLNFDFPITALVGPNGAGKTSVLYALYGTPFRKTTGDYWFSTVVDPITEGEGSPNRYIYGRYHKQLKIIIETRKSRVRKKIEGVDNPNYWEPSKITPGDNMAPIPLDMNIKKPQGLSKSRDRWHPVKRNVVFINFRQEISAFDKYFYFGSSPNLKTIKKKSDLIRRDSKPLKEIIEKNLKSYKRGKREMILENRKLKKEEILWIKHILEKEYTDARAIRHNFFRVSCGLSILFETPHRNYSEAFAGSGEIAVCSAVIQILKAKAGALILLDEPEVSLHPGAQERFLKFLLNQAIKKQLQVVFSTHSPSMLTGLPNKAIKVFQQDKDGTSSIINESSSNAAFIRLGYSHTNKTIIIVEDRLAQHVVEASLFYIDEPERKLFDVTYLPGGADTILTHRLQNIMTTGENILFLLDGDKKTNEIFTHPSHIPESENSNLDEIIEKQIGAKVKFLLDSNSNEKKYETQRLFLGYIHRHLKYLPLSCPEEIICQSVGLDCNEKKSKEYEDKLYTYISDITGNKPNSDEVDDTAKILILQNKENNPYLKEIAQTLSDFSLRSPDC